ncbi:MAG TPA: orotidine 5'-phosphate decarboxylase / HUMPS family protein [archaeon]|nr:orotidine 5'-phosphate decarboxylase / HUMPS family protein [archaeon]
MLDTKTRYLQIAFNDDLSSVYRILPLIEKSDRILIEAGTPFIKREGFRGISQIKSLWGGNVVADLKTMDGAAEEVELAQKAGATAATVLGSASVETLNLFIEKCEELGLDSMVDMIGVEEPLKVLLKLKKSPIVVILHKGRDEETTRGKVIKYKHINKIRSKYDVLISAAGGVDLREARSAIFNGANIIVVNIVSKSDPWTGIHDDENVADIAKKFLETIE